ncbi:MAG: Holliday junction branch migration protein RuvA [bacterium]
MFDFIEGSPEKLTPNHAVINVGGVGFGVSISTSSYEALKLEPGKIKLFTYLHVRENVLELYGFVRIEDKEIFLMLMEVNGIGAKSAMNILNKITAAQLQRAIASEDSKTLMKIPGLGGKKAQRILLELKDKFKNVDFAEDGKGGTMDEEDEYVEALASLGFNYTQAREALRKAMKEVKNPKNKEAVIKEALKRLANR